MNSICVLHGRDVVMCFCLHSKRKRKTALKRRILHPVITSTRDEMATRVTFSFFYTLNTRNTRIGESPDSSQTEIGDERLSRVKLFNSAIASNL